MTAYHVRPRAQSYGHDIGILLVDCHTPFIPGDVGNATTYGYPVLYRTMEGVSLGRLIEDGDLSMMQQIMDAALWLQDAGVKAITSDCGYMLHFQKQVASALNIPVMLSSLLQLPFVASLLNPDQSVGVLCANRRRLTPELLAIAYPQQTHAIHVRGLEDKPFFRGPILDETDVLDAAAIEQEVVTVVQEMVHSQPSIGAFVLECSNLPPYAHAIQAATGRPVFDFITMIDHVRAATRRRPYSGNY